MQQIKGCLYHMDSESTLFIIYYIFVLAYQSGTGKAFLRFSWMRESANLKKLFPRTLRLRNDQERMWSAEEISACTSPSTLKLFGG
jgi:hypothetical protein